MVDVADFFPCFLDDFRCRLEAEDVDAEDILPLSILEVEPASIALALAAGLADLLVDVCPANALPAAPSITAIAKVDTNFLMYGFSPLLILSVNSSLAFEPV